MYARLLFVVVGIFRALLARFTPFGRVFWPLRLGITGCRRYTLAHE
jgi:hypothetical protein